MGTINNVLKNLCCCYGWSYGVFWSFDQQNAIFLTMQAAYFDEEIRGLIESLCQQVHMLGGGFIGQVAFTKNHQWMCFENHNRQQSSSNSISDVFLDASEFDCQYSCGIKTIAAIPVEPQGVVVLGSTQKIMETVEFVNQTKRMFQETGDHGMFEDAYVTDGVHGSAGPTCSLACSIQSCFLSSNSQPILPDHNQSDNWLQPNNLSFQESWNTLPTRSNGQDLCDPLQDFVIPDDLDISQWIQEPISMNLEQKGGNLMPIVKESQLDFHYQKSNNQVGVDSSTPCSTKGLFSKLKIDELFEGISGISHGGSSTAKNHVEPPKAAKKKAKPGTRPRPKDRQQILDRMAELRELIPNGNKMNIDTLLDRTIKHMVFLQSVTKHADRIKQAAEPKKNTGNDATWAYELGNQTMACPLIVEDLNTPGQMLIEILCEERGFFLEMVDIIKSFGVIILKGVMEMRDKIWARFIVEAEARRRVTRHEIFSALVQFLQATHLEDNRVRNMIMEENNRLLGGYQQSLVQLPVSLPETDYCIDF